MKRLLITLAIALTVNMSFSQVGIGTSNPESSAQLEVKSADKGFLMPRVISHANIIAPAEGLQVYDLTTKTIWYHDADEWVENNKNLNSEINDNDVSTHVFILAGQSNAVGRDQLIGDDYSNGIMQVARGGINGHTEGSIIQAVSPLDHFNANPGDMSFTVSFFREYQKVFPNANIVIIPCAAGGTGFHTGYWRQGGTGYNSMVSRVNTYFIDHPNAILKGLLWHQGEADYNKDSYATDLPAFFTNIENDIPRYTKDIPTILGLPVESFKKGTNKRKELDDIINGIMFSRANTFTVSSSGLTTKSDNLHFNSEGLIGLGKRYFNAYLSILENTQIIDYFNNNTGSNDIDTWLTLTPIIENHAGSPVGSMDERTTALRVNTKNYAPPIHVVASGGGWAPAAIVFENTESKKRGAGVYMHNTMSDVGGVSGRSWFAGIPYNINNDKYILGFRDNTSFNSNLAKTDFAILTVTGLNKRVGIGTSDPDEKFEVEFGDANKDVEIGVGTTDPDITFLTLRSPNGTKYYITVDDNGILTTSTTKP